MKNLLVLEISGLKWVCTLPDFTYVQYFPALQLSSVQTAFDPSKSVNKFCWLRLKNIVRQMIIIECRQMLIAGEQYVYGILKPRTRLKIVIEKESYYCDIVIWQILYFLALGEIPWLPSVHLKPVSNMFHPCTTSTVQNSNVWYIWRKFIESLLKFKVRLFFTIIMLEWMSHVWLFNFIVV